MFNPMENDEDDDKAKLDVLTDLLSHAGDLLMDMKTKEGMEDPMQKPGMADDQDSGTNPADAMNPLKNSLTGNGMQDKSGAVGDKMSADVASQDDGMDAQDEGTSDSMPADDEIDRLKSFMESSAPPNKKVGKQMGAGRAPMAAAVMIKKKM